MVDEGREASLSPGASQRGKRAGRVIRGGRMLIKSCSVQCHFVPMPAQSALIPPPGFDPPDSQPQQPDALLVLLPLLIVLSTFLFLLLIFLVCVLLIRRRRGIVLRDNDGPVDMSREELIEGEGGFEGVEERWLESVNENVRRAYARAKGSVPS